MRTGAPRSRPFIRAWGSGELFERALPDLARIVVTKFGLPGERGGEAVAAVERFKAEMRPDDAERAALLDQMAGILTEQERQDLEAALTRRPLVKGGGLVIASAFAGDKVTFDSILRSELTPHGETAFSVTVAKEF